MSDRHSYRGTCVLRLATRQARGPTARPQTTILYDNVIHRRQKYFLTSNQHLQIDQSLGANEFVRPGVRRMSVRLDDLPSESTDKKACLPKATELGLMASVRREPRGREAESGDKTCRFILRLSRLHCMVRAQRCELTTSVGARLKCK
jgi:hypothetical protein